MRGVQVMDTSKFKWFKRAIYILIAGILIIGIGDSLWWQDLVGMLNRPEGLTVYVR
jgi:hypothetical protein